MPATIGFSGHRLLVVLEAVDIVIPVLTELDAAVYVTGGAVGVDAFVGAWLARFRPDARHIVIVPSHRGQVDFWWEKPFFEGRIEVVAMADGTSFAARNQTIVDSVEVLHAFPRYPENDPRSLRSGTWQTVRMAQRAGREVFRHLLAPPAETPATP